MLPSRPFRIALFASVSPVVLTIAMAAANGVNEALAQDVQASFETAENKTIEFAADELSYDEASGEAIAIGNVVVSQDGFVLKADRVQYHQENGIVRAIGQVQITDPSGNILMVDEVELDDRLREGFVQNVRLLLSDDSRLAASDGQRIDGRRTIMNYAVYSPCNVCETKPNKKPLWQIKAVRVVHDQDTRRLYYKNAVLEMFGLPVAWLPYLSHPDPTVERESGFLAPEVRQRKELGVVFAAPYHFAISPSQDATITPIITTKEGLVVAGEYRRHVGFGTMQFDGSATYVDERDANNVKTGSHEFRGHLFSNGQFRHGKRWRSTYKFQVASDDTYLRRYSFSNLDTLTSDFNAEGTYGRSYANIRSLWFQGLRIEDEQGLTGFALPAAEFDYVGKPDRRGGVLRGNFSTLAVHRTDGLDTRRVSARGSWEVPYTTSLGQQLKLGASMRTDLYHIGDADRPDIAAFGGQDGFKARFLPNLTAMASWPLMRAGASGHQIIEPIFNIVVAPDGGNPSEISNEDSRTFELTDANLFSTNRFPGIDRWEGGTRVSYGGRWGFYSGRLTSEVFVGQSYRFNDRDVVFPDGSGISGKFSDIVGRWDVSISGLFDIAHRFRLDKDSLAIRRNEIDATVGNEKRRVTLGYFQLNRNRQAEGLDDREEIRANGEFRIKTNWTFFGDITQDLTGGRRGVAHGLGLRYMDECLELSLAWRKNFTEDRDIVPGSSINFRIRLKHLG